MKIAPAAGLLMFLKNPNPLKSTDQKESPNPQRCINWGPSVDSAGV
jgi:hypothetical protein